MINQLCHKSLTSYCNSFEDYEAVYTQYEFSTAWDDVLCGREQPTTPHDVGQYIRLQVYQKFIAPLSLLKLVMRRLIFQVSWQPL